MPLLTLQQLIENEPGCSLPAAADDKAELLSDVARGVVMDLPPTVHRAVATLEAIPTTGLAIDDKHIVAIEHDSKGLVIPLLDQTHKAAFTLAGNAKHRSSFAAFIEAGLLYVYERGSATRVAVASAWTLTMPTTVDGTEDVNVPPLLHRDSVSLVAWQACMRLLGDTMSNTRINDLLAAAAITVGTVPPAPTAPVIVAGTIVPGSASGSTATAGSATAGTDPAAGAEPVAGQHGVAQPTDETPPTLPTTPPDITDAEWNSFKGSTPPPDEATTQTTPTWPTTDFQLPDDLASDWYGFLNAEATEMLNQIHTYFARLIEEHNTNVRTILEGFNADLKLWEIEVQRLVQNENWLSIYQSQTLAQSVNEFEARVNESIGKYRSSVEGGIGDARNLTEARITKFRGDLEAAITKSRNETEASIASGRYTTEASIATARNNTEASIAQMQADTEASVQQIRATLEALVADWQGDVQQHERAMHQFLGEIERIAVANQERVRNATTRLQMLAEQIARIEERYRKLRDRYVRNYGIHTARTLRAFYA